MTNNQLAIEEINLLKIDLSHQPFLIGYPAVDSLTNQESLKPLLCSIKTYGLLSPLLIFKAKTDTIYLIHGLQRFLVCRSAGWSSIPAMVLPPSISEAELYVLSLSLFLSHHKPNLMEQAKIIERLLTFFPPSQVVKEFLPRLGLPASDRVMARILPLTKLEDVIGIDLAGSLINPELGFRLLSVDPSVRLRLYQFLRQYPFTVSQQFEVLGYLQEIASRENLTISQILSEPMLAEAPAQNKDNRPDDKRLKAQTIRIFLRQRRYPMLTAMEDEFTREKKELRLPEKIDLAPPAGFEHGNYSLEVKFATYEEFQNKLTFIQHLSDKKEFRKMIKS